MLPEPEKKTVDYYRRLSEKDLMTGLYNRGSFEYYVKKRLESGEGGTFYMIDLDDFKAVNDTYGHVAGDRVIMDMADILRRIFAKEAVIGRLGAMSSQFMRRAAAAERKRRKKPGPFCRTTALYPKNTEMISAELFHRHVPGSR